MFSFKKNNWKDHSDEDLMNQVIEGNRIALELIYERYAEKLCWYAFGFVKDHETAQDLVQEVFMTLIELPERFDTERTFSTWIYTVTANRCRNQLRKEKMHEDQRQSHAYLNRNQVEHTHSMMDLSSLELSLAHIYRTLSQKEQELFRLRFAEKLPLKMIAEKLHIPEGSVKSGLYYLLKKYTPLLKQYQDE